MDGDRTPDEQVEIENEPVSNLDENVELTATVSYSLDQRIMEGCVISAVIEPKGQETIVAVSVTNKIIIKGLIHQNISTIRVGLI